ncbi:hypothetical protein KY289_035753 [Solanum tuberosum]|nr:hypothetical protein KY289_035753 [Solanum tuberosum]
MGTVMTCSICRGANHNKRNCTKNLNLSLHQHPLKSPPSSSNTGTRRGQELWDKVYLLLILDIHVLIIRRVNTGVQSSVHVTGDIGLNLPRD